MGVCMWVSGAGAEPTEPKVQMVKGVWARVKAECAIWDVQIENYIESTV